MSSFARHRLAKPAVIAVSGALVATLALPAYAFDRTAVATDTVAAAPVQDLASLPLANVEPATIIRDDYTATKPVVTALTNRFTVLNPPAQSYSGAAVVAYAMQFVGVVPYGSGNSPSTSFSCDGLTQYVFAGFGISLPRTVSGQAARMVPISVSDAVPGDLVMWPGHIGIYAGGGMVIDSPRPGRYVEYRAIWGNPVYLRLNV